LLRIFRAPCQHAITKRFSAQQLYWVSTLVPGTGGIFEVRVGDKVVAKRSMGHFPDEIEIVKAVAAAEKAAPTA